MLDSYVPWRLDYYLFCCIVICNIEGNHVHTVLEYQELVAIP